MPSLFDFSVAQKQIQQSVENLSFTRNPVELYEPIRYLLALGGKRMRPILVLLGYSLFDDEYEKAIEPAVAVEVFHNFTLMHDDIMDKAPLRRGKPTVHHQWNENVAILSGDVMLVEAYRLLKNIDNQHFKTIFDLFNDCAAAVCEGQQFDMNFESQSNISVDDYIEMIKRKTAVLLGFSLQMGAILANAPRHQADLLQDFGTNIGIGFQLKDDLLDVYGNPLKFGKQVGGDIVANKKTFLLITALQEAQDETAKELNRWLSEISFDIAEKVTAVTQIYDQLHIKTKTEIKMNEYFDKAFEILEKLEVQELKKQTLKQFAQDLIQRES